MWRFALVAALTLVLGSSASAQPPRGSSRGGEDVKKLQDEVAKLQGQLKEMEARLAKATGDAKKEADKKEADKKDEGRRGQGGFGRGGFGPFGGFPGRGPMGGKPEPKKEADKKETEKKEEPRGFGRFGSRSGERPEASRTAELEKKLDKLIEEMESLRREIRRR